MTWAGERVTLSGGTRLNLEWTKYKGSIYEAAVTMPSIMTDTERLHWASTSHMIPHTHPFQNGANQERCVSLTAPIGAGDKTRLESL